MIGRRWIAGSPTREMDDDAVKCCWAGPGHQTANAELVGSAQAVRLTHSVLTVLRRSGPGFQTGSGDAIAMASMGL